MYIQSTVKGLSYDGDLVTSHDVATPENKIGTKVALATREGTRCFRYVKFQEAFVKGQLAGIYYYIDNADVDAAATTSQKTLTGTSDFTANEFNDGTYRSAFVSIDANTGVGQTHAIHRNFGSANIITTDRNWAVALDATSDFVTYDPNFVSLADTDDGPVIPMGVAISAQTANYYGWIQVEGFCPEVRAVGSTDPTITGDIVVASSTAGAIKGRTAAGITAAEASKVVGYALMAYAGADAVNQYVPVILTGCVGMKF